MNEKTLYVGIDIAKDKFDVAFTIDGSQTFEHTSISNDKKGFKLLLKKTLKIQKKTESAQIHFCMEATGIYHCGLCEFLQEHSDQVSVVNPIRTKSFSKSLMLRTKNDKVDSSMLSLYAFFHKPPATPKTPEIIKKFRALVRYQESLVESRTQEIARLKSSLDSEIKQLINKKIVFIEKQVAQVIAKIQALIKTDEFLTKQINLLKTVDGIGDKVAWKLLSEIKFETIENISPKAQVAHAGLSPKEHSSGSSIKARPHISRMGNSDMRKVLFLPALGCIKNPNHFTPFYLRLLDNGKPKKLAVVAVMRKMLLTAAGVLRNQEPFDPNWAHKTQENYMNSLKVA
jgi:transposase